MFGYLCAFKNGYLFTGLHEQNWILRLNEEDRLHAIKTFKTDLFEPMKGRVMKEYILLPQEVLSNQETLKEWIQKSIDFISTKKPKKKKR